VLAKLKKQIEVELALLRMLMDRYPELLAKTESDAPTAVTRLQVQVAALFLKPVAST
jgi:hypothetical protein